MSDSEHSLEFRVLGPLEVWRDGHEAQLTGARERTLLAVLLVHANEVVSSDRLVDELWGERPPDTAVAALHGLVSQLRRALEPDRRPRGPGSVLVTRAPGYQLLVPRGTLDSHRFEELLTDGRCAVESGEVDRAATLLRRALGLWRGSAFSGCDEAPSVHADALRLDELRFEALEERIDADLARGRDDELVPELEALVEREPLRERLRGQLMLALYRSGRQAEALEVYRDTRTTFRARLGIEPSPQLRELEQAMLRQDPELAAGLPRLRPRRRVRGRRRVLLVVGVPVVVALVTVVAAATMLAPGTSPLRGPPGSVAVLDPSSTRVVDTIRVGTGPAGVVYGHGSVWVANAEDETVSRVDPETREVVRVIGVESPVDLAVGADGIWVAGGIDGTVSRIDPETNAVVGRVELGPGDSDAPVTVQGVAAGEDAVWAVASEVGLVRIDPASNRIMDSVAIEQPLAVAAGHGSVWVVTGSAELIRLEPRTLAVTARTVVGSPVDVEAIDDGLLVISSPALFEPANLKLVAPATAEVVRTIELAGSVSGAADTPGLGFWAVTREGVATHVELGSGPGASSIVTESEPSGIAVGAGAVWVAIREPEP